MRWTPVIIASFNVIATFILVRWFGFNFIYVIAIISSVGLLLTLLVAGVVGLFLSPGDRHEMWRIIWATTKENLQSLFRTLTFGDSISLKRHSSLIVRFPNKKQTLGALTVGVLFQVIVGAIPVSAGSAPFLVLLDLIAFIAMLIAIAGFVRNGIDR